MNADGSNLRRLTSDPAVDWFPVWSPNGKEIAFCSRRSGSNLDIYVMDTTGKVLQQLTDSPGDDFNPSWRP